MKRTYGRRGVVLAATALLGGCGFQPVYMRTASGKAGPAQRELETVFVRIIGERPGQLLRLALQERFGSDDSPEFHYDLAVSYSVSGEALGIEQSSIATRVRLVGNAYWTLLRRETPQSVVTTGRARTYDGIDLFDSQYFAADQGIESAQQRIANEIAQQIATQLAVWFRHQADKQAG